jgi:hypothetical protein
MIRALRVALPLILVFRLALTALGLGPVAVSPADGEAGQPTEITLVWEPGVHTNLIANGSFEQGIGGWGALAGNTLFESVVSADAIDGTRIGRLTQRQVRPQADIFIFQQVAIPTYQASVRLLWNDFTIGGGSLDGVFRVMASVSGPSVPTVLHQSPVGLNDTAGAWNPREADLSAFRGKTVILDYGMTNFRSQPMTLRLEGVRLEVTPTAPTYEAFLGLSTNLLAANRVSQGSSPSVTVPGLKPATRYYWRVDQIAGGRRVASPVYSFVTDGVLPPVRPVIASVSADGSTFQFRFNSEVGRTYRVERLADLASGVWLPEPGTFDGDGSDLMVDFPMDDPEAALYRVVVE